MRVLPEPKDDTAPRIPVRARETLSFFSLEQPGTFDDGLDVTQTSVCLRCPGRYCGQFQPGELADAIDKRNDLVCPVDAITFVKGEPIIGDACIGCGLCVMRCPYGSLFLDSGGRPQHEEPEEKTYVEVSTEEFVQFEDQLARSRLYDPIETAATLRTIIERAAHLDKNGFYPLISSLLTAAGFPTVTSRVGDTSNRFDALIIDAAASIPLELKAPREVGYVNVKSVQQALENKVVLDSRGFVASLPSISTLVVGYEYPAQRSDVLALIDDIEASFSIKVGILDLNAVYTLVVDAYMKATPPDPEILRQLKGTL